MPILGASETLKVGVSVFEPFVMKDQAGTLTGFDIDYWNAICEENGWTCEFKELALPEKISALSKKQIDVALGGVSITRNRENAGIDFSIPYYNSGLKVLVNYSFRIPWISIIKTIGLNLAILATIIVVLAHFVWWAELGQINFDDEYKIGIFQAMWYSIVTAATVGYGDYVPKKAAGKMVGVLIMIVGITMFSWTSGKIIGMSIQNEQRINSIEDLKRQDVAVKANTSAVNSVKENGSNPIVVSNYADAYDLLREKKVKAVVADEPQLAYYHSSQNNKTELVGELFNNQYYAFAVTEDNPILEKINRTHLKFVENGVYAAIKKKYFGK